MKFLITAGNTLTPIDRVRSITNVFTGRTGARIASVAQARGHHVTLLTSHPETVETPSELLQLQLYRTFDDLERLLASSLADEKPDVVVHSAAVSDYRSAGIYAPDARTRFVAERGEWQCDGPSLPQLLDRSADKVKSDEPELWLRLVRTPKLVDRIRTDWDFRGVLVKFKLEVGVGDEQLLALAERSRLQSSADFMVANTLEGMNSWGYLGPIEGRYLRIERRELAQRLVETIEKSR